MIKGYAMKTLLSHIPSLMPSPIGLSLCGAALLLLAGCAEESNIDAQSADTSENCHIEFIILGTGQDAGAPQIGNADDPAWKDSKQRLTATSAALIDHRNDRRYLFEATPDISEQINLLDTLSPSQNGPLGLSGVFITHAHIGHYAGLMMFGREAAGAKGLDVYAMPRMEGYLKNNGPWDQLVTLNNIVINSIADRKSVTLSDGLSITPYRVPHRDEYSETVGFVINTPDKNALFLPDIDSWAEWERDFNIRIADMVAQVDVAYLDATFFSDSELPGRDMSLIPHPRVTQSMDMFDALPDDVKSKVRFIHMNHTNPLRFENSPEARQVRERGYSAAKSGDRFCLLNS